MISRRKFAQRLKRRATILTQTVIFGGAVGVGVAALAVDTGLMFSAKQELQSAADAAALAAAAKLGASCEAQNAAVVEAALYASLNEIAGDGADLIDSDVVLGHAVLNGERFDFMPGEQPYDAVRVTLKRDQTVADGPVSLVFGKTLGVDGARLQASATAMLTPRDIAIVIDLSGSMNDDSEMRHYDDFTSEAGGETRPGVQVNLEDVWLALPCEKGNNGVGNGIDPQPPGNPSNYNDQPGTGPGSPNSQGGNPSPGAEPTGPNGGCGGPRWGWMTGFGNTIVLGSYTPVGDPGLYHIPRSATCSDAEVIANITEAGYSTAERTALLSGSFDSNSTYYINRVKVLLGLAGWKSKKPGGKYNGGPGNGDNKVDTNELTQEAGYSFGGGSWNDWVNYVMSTSNQMYATDSNFRYRYGIKTFVNYLLEKQGSHTKCPELAGAPEMPLYSVKEAVQAMVDTIVDLQTQDYCSLEIFATSGRHEIDLTGPDGETSAEVALQVIPDTLFERQAGHYDNTTCIGCGVDEAIEELTSERGRDSAAKVMIVLTDGKPNIAPNGSNPESYCVDRVTEASEMGITVYTIGVGADVQADLLEEMAEIGHGQYFFADNAPDPVTGLPMYVQQLRDIFETLGGERPVRLIQ
ncbi:MAG: hypothetical protein DCC65_17845 [Planctomycetota bacterium]|nr:MAG: hypothetical protein DCC65_17845 [Planctomycetota bacterium]